MAKRLRIAAGAAAATALFAGAALTSRAPNVPAAFAPRPAAPALVRLGAGAPDIAADTVLIQRLRTGEELFGRNADAPRPVASLTKLMTALLLAEAADPLDIVSFSAEAGSAGDPDEKRSAVPTGERLRVEDTLRLLLAASDSDAAYAAAEHVAVRRRPELAGTPFAARIEAFVGLMDERAHVLGLAATRFANPAGSDDPRAAATANDLARLAGYITSRHPELWAASRVREGFAFGAGGRQGRASPPAGRRYGIVNTNPLLEEFPAVYGSKTGFDDLARGALLMVYRLSAQEPIAIVILRSPDRTSDGRAAIRWLESSFMLESP